MIKKKKRARRLKAREERERETGPKKNEVGSLSPSLPVSRTWKSSLFHCLRMELILIGMQRWRTKMLKSLFTKMRIILKWIMKRWVQFRWWHLTNSEGIQRILRISKLLTAATCKKKMNLIQSWWQVQWFRNRNSICRADAFNKWLMSHNHSYKVETSVSTVNAENELEKQNYKVDIKRQCETMLPNHFPYFLLTVQKAATHSVQKANINYWLK